MEWGNAFLVFLGLNIFFGVMVLIEIKNVLRSIVKQLSALNEGLSQHNSNNLLNEALRRTSE